MDKKYKKMVYICSPYAGDIEKNTERARKYSRWAVECGCIPIAPHLLFPQFMSEETEREEALFNGIVLLGNINYRAATISERAVSDAWKAKRNQVYQKAKLSFGNDPDFGRIQAIVNDSQLEAKKQNKQLILGLSVAGGIFLFCVLSLFLIAFVGFRKEANADKQLKAVVVEIQEDLSKPLQEGYRGEPRL